MYLSAENRAAPHRTARSFVNVGVESRVTVLEQTLIVIVSTADNAQQGNWREESEVLETAKMKTPKRTETN